MSTATPRRDQPADGSGTDPGRGRRLAGWGVIGLLVAALVAFGVGPVLLPESYSWTEHGISEAAAQGVEQAWPARLGFIAFGLAVVWLAGLRPSSWGPLATLCHLVFGVCMFGVAAFSARSWEERAPFVEREDSLHSSFATVMGFAFVVGVVTLIVQRRHRPIFAALPDWIAGAVAVGVPLTMSTGMWGVLQRVMFLTAAIWYGHEALLATTEAAHPGASTSTSITGSAVGSRASDGQTPTGSTAENAPGERPSVVRAGHRTLGK